MLKNFRNYFQFLFVSDVSAGSVVITTSAKPKHSPPEKRTTASSTTPSESSEEEEDADDEGQLGESDEHGELASPTGFRSDLESGYYRLSETDAAFIKHLTSCLL